MKIEDLLQSVAPLWHEAFTRFVQTGEAENEFLDYLNNDESAQHAVQTAFEAQAQAFEAIAHELKQPRIPAGEYCNTQGYLGISKKAAQAVEDIMLLSPPESREAMQKTVQALNVSLDSAQKEILVETIIGTLAPEVISTGMNIPRAFGR
jgi:hypothetical protein